jgi:hypothetical protein
MENYKADYYNPETFEKSEIETRIPVDLVNQVKQTLDGIEGYMITPTMINPEDNSVMFGVMNMKDKILKYKVTISPNNKKTKFKVGDKAVKVSGYKFPCTIVSVFETIEGNIRVVGEMDEFGLLHIFNEDQLELVNNG